LRIEDVAEFRQRAVGKEDLVKDPAMSVEASGASFLVITSCRSHQRRSNLLGRGSVDELFARGGIKEKASLIFRRRIFLGRSLQELAKLKATPSREGLKARGRGHRGGRHSKEEGKEDLHDAFQLD
jgi:hypothetical protein